jgi:hypothetical protein
MDGAAVDSTERSRLASLVQLLNGVHTGQEGGGGRGIQDQAHDELWKAGYPDAPKTTSAATMDRKAKPDAP